MPLRERLAYTNSDTFFESSQRPLSVLSSLTTNEGLANPDAHDQHFTESTGPPEKQITHAERNLSTRGPQQTRIEQPLMAHLVVGHLDLRCPFPQCSGRRFGRTYEYE